MLKHLQFAGLAALLLLTSSTALAQVFPRGNGISLTGLDRVDVFVRVAHWEGLSADPQEFRLDTQRRLVDALERIGVSSRPSRTDQLICNIHAQQDGNQVVYATRLEYWMLKSTDVHVLQWEQEAIGSVRARSFDARQMARICADFFSDEWHKWNVAD